jgi:hypothetical protein
MRWSLLRQGARRDLAESQKHRARDGANGFTYDLQELAFFSWFYGAPSIAVNNWFADNNTFKTDAGPVCTKH